jgi:outer membrane protein assembly factor BamA
VWQLQHVGLGASSIGELALAVASLIKNWLALGTTATISVSVSTSSSVSLSVNFSTSYFLTTPTADL